MVAAGLFTTTPIIELTTCNLNGLNANGHLVAQRLKSPTQCVLFQETKINNTKHLDTFKFHLSNEVGAEAYKLFCNDHRALRSDTLNHRSCGVASYFHSSMPGFDDLQHLVHLDLPDRYLVVRTLWLGTPVYFHNVYAPVLPHHRRAFFEALPRDFEPDSVHLVGGDFNLPFEAALDASIPRVDGNTGKAECFAWLTALRLVDPWRIHHPHERVYSGPGRSNRLDYLLVDQDLMANYYKDALYCKNIFGGDHLQHSLTLSNGAHDHRQGPWRLPKELLSNPNIVNAIKEEASRLLDAMSLDDNLNHGAMWYGWLKRMKKRLQTCHRHHLQYWKETLHRLKLAWLAARQSAADHGDLSGRVATARDAYDTTKSEYEQLLKDQQFDFHANVNERGTSHFFRRPQGYKVPICTATIDGVTVSDKATVQAAFTAHWKSIMRCPDAGPRQINRSQRRAVIRALSKRLTPAQREELDSPITDAELCASLKTMKPNKSPGPDGWPACFFQVAPETFSKILVKVFNYQRTQHGMLLHQQRRSAVALLFKDGDRGNPGNYRPIALMSVEVKILSRALAYRLASVAPHLVHPSQAGFVPGRRLHDHVLLVQALQTFCTNEDHDYYATFLDFSKAYDMVDQGFLFDVLTEMNIGPTFISWVQLLYESPIVQLIFGGTLGPVIRPNRGVKQGCPLSCLLFVLYLEPLGEMLRAQPQHGIPLPDDEVKTSIFFADDSTLLSNSLSSAVAQMEIVDTFCSVSGARLNQRKCMTLVLNDHLDPADIDAEDLLNILPSGRPAKYLGVLFGHRLAADFQAQVLRDKFLAAFPLWGGRARTIQGRKLLVSTMLLSILWHVTAAVPIPQPIVDEMQSMTNKFILGRKTLRADKYRTFINRPLQHDKQLGLGIPHVASIIRQQRLVRVQQLMATPRSNVTPSWRPLVQRQFARVMGQLYRDDYPFDFLLYFPNTSSKWIVLRELHPFWRDVWKHWSAVPMTKRIEAPPTFNTVMNLPLWLTSYEPMHNGPPKYSACLASEPNIRRWCLHGASNGLRSLKDFLNTDGSWPTQAMFIARMSQGNPAARVRLSATRDHMEFCAIERSVPIYRHITRVYEQIGRLFDIRPGALSPGLAHTAHPFFGYVKKQSQSFCAWPKKKLSDLAYHAPPVSSTHPAATSSRTSTEDLAKYMRFVRRTCRAPTPVQGDVWLRLILRMLPVNSRFSYKQVIDPAAITCTYGCGAVETEHHAFHTCNEVFPTWQFHAGAWRRFGVRFDWATITNIDAFTVNPAYGANKAALFKLWSLLTASILHTVWTQHNAIKYDCKHPWPRRVWEETTFIGWMASVRRWLRLQDPIDELRIDVLAQLAILKRQRPYRALWLKYPNCLALDLSVQLP